LRLTAEQWTMTSEKNCLKITHNGHELVEGSLSIGGMIHNTTTTTKKAVQTTGSALSATSDIHRQVPTNMAGICHDWLTNQNTDQCFVVIGLSTRQSHSAFQQLKIDQVRQLGLPYWLAPSWCQRIFINIRGQYGIKKNIYIHPWFRLRRRTVKCSGENVADRPPPRLITSDPPTSSSWQHQHTN